MDCGYDHEYIESQWLETITIVYGARVLPVPKIASLKPRDLN